MSHQRLFQKLITAVGAFCLLMGISLAAWQGVSYQNAQKAALENGLTYTLQQSETVARYIDDEMLAQKTVTDWVAEQMSTASLDQETVNRLLGAGIERKPNLYGLSIAFEPYLFPGQRLFAPYFQLTDTGLRKIVQVETKYDYTDVNLPTTVWYTQTVGNQKSGWYNYYGKASDDWLIEYSTPFYRNGKVAGVVASVHSINTTFRQFLRHIPIGQEGYIVLLDENGTIVNHPMREFNGISITEVALHGLATPDYVLEDAGRRMLVKAEQFYVARKAANGAQTWTTFETLPTAGWKMSVVMGQDVLGMSNAERIRRLTNLGLGILLAMAGLAALVFRPTPGNLKRIWGFSITFGVSVLLGIAWVWVLVYYHPMENGSRTALVNDLDIARELAPIENAVAAGNRDEPLRVPTGVVIETLAVGNHTASVTGYLWQKYPLQVEEAQIVPPQFTNQITSASWQESYQFVWNGFRVVGWAFAVELSETFDVSRYPLDEITVKLKLEPADLARNLIFVPDLDGYEFIAPSNLPGLSSSVHLPGWNIRTAYFTFESINYNVNFGGALKVFKNTNPTLLYNIHATRSLFSPLIAYCIVIYVILVQIFGIVMIKIENPLEVLSVGAALFLVNAISHNTLRNELAASRTIYLEYYFILLYVTILASSINGIARTLNLNLKILQINDNLLAKVLFWPLYLSICFVFTLLVFYP